MVGSHWPEESLGRGADSLKFEADTLRCISSTSDGGGGVPPFTV